MSLTNNYLKLKQIIPEGVEFVAVSKQQSTISIQELYNLGQRIFGENRVQELVAKYEQLPKDIEWHMIGNLQTNKVKYIAPFISLIQSVNNIKLLDEINKHAIRNNRIINCLLEVHIASELSKSGFSVQEIADLYEDEIPEKFTNVNIKGLMGMATYTDNMRTILNEFKTLTNLYTLIKEKHKKNYPDYKIISIGMSGDYHLALKAGSTMVRIGSYLFNNEQ